MTLVFQLESKTTLYNFILGLLRLSFFSMSTVGLQSRMMAFTLRAQLSKCSPPDSPCGWSVDRVNIAPIRTQSESPRQGHLPIGEHVFKGAPFKGEMGESVWLLSNVHSM